MLLAARNIVKSWLLVLALVGVFALIGWGLGGVQGLSIFVFCALLVAAGAYWSFDRVVLGMLGARELPVVENCGRWLCACENGAFRALD